MSIVVIRRHLQFEFNISMLVAFLASVFKFALFVEIEVVCIRENFIKGKALLLDRDNEFLSMASTLGRCARAN